MLGRDGEPRVRLHGPVREFQESGGLLQLALGLDPAGADVAAKPVGYLGAVLLGPALTAGVFASEVAP
ncbi:MAG: hypothetical protein AVDCRST_MAG90-1832 [uncultured Microvirga sp.]|uniref:Uncharacterized protein n=1 Tax=uncultured Microvirga sp. TaxID=412392 RepID=A0A6J4LR26_9HYPH|nr:MAG: hypothetical protein AVDCRST_MAG90-1832 [uncultured Microvirga sp.]